MESRSYLKATMIYKITNNLVNIPCSQSLIPCMYLTYSAPSTLLPAPSL